MMGLVVIPVAIVISFLWYMPVVIAQGENKTLKKADYWKTALKYGFLYSCLLIMLTEIIWDKIFRNIPLDGLAKNIFEDFFRAALLEEFFKFTAFKMAKKKMNLNRKMEYILIAGLMGLMYSIFEKAALGNIGGAIVGTVIPMHIMWQMNQGAHYFEYEKALAVSDKTTAKKEWFKAIPMTFLFHGIWDSAIDISGSFVDDKYSGAVQAMGTILLIGLVVFGLFYTIRTVKRWRRLAKENENI